MTNRTLSEIVSWGNRFLYSDEMPKQVEGGKLKATGYNGKVYGTFDTIEDCFIAFRIVEAKALELWYKDPFNKWSFHDDCKKATSLYHTWNAGFPVKVFSLKTPDVNIKLSIIKRSQDDD